MSSHTLDLSGQRQAQLTLNDPAVTKLWTPAKAGDDAQISFGGAKEIRIAIYGGAKIERRRRYRQTPKRVNGQIVKAGDEIVYEKEPYEDLVLVLGGSCSGFVRGSLIEPPADPQPGYVYESFISSTVTVKRFGEQLHYLESGELLDQWMLDELLPAVS